MSCVLRIGGPDLDIDKLLETIELKPEAVFKRGMPRQTSRSEGKINSDTGANFIVSDAEFSDFPGQVADASSFLNSNRQQFQLIRDFPGIDSLALDFAVEIDPERFTCSFKFPAELVALAALANVFLELSIYPME